MIPKYYIFLNEFPLNQNGKLDRRQLLSLLSSRSLASLYASNSTSIPPQNHIHNLAAPSEKSFTKILPPLNSYNSDSDAESKLMQIFSKYISPQRMEEFDSSKPWMDFVTNSSHITELFMDIKRSQETSELPTDMKNPLEKFTMINFYKWNSVKGIANHFRTTTE